MPVSAIVPDVRRNGEDGEGERETKSCISLYNGMGRSDLSRRERGRCLFNSRQKQNLYKGSIKELVQLLIKWAR